MPRTDRRSRRVLPSDPEAGVPAAGSSISRLLERLEARIAHHREEEALHAERTAFHQTERERHAAELVRLSQHLEALRASATVAQEEGEGIPETEAPPEKPVDLGSLRRPKISKMVSVALERLAPEATLTASSLAEEINRHFGDRLRRPITNRQTSVVLRRMGLSGRLKIEKLGTSHSETVYRI